MFMPPKVGDIQKGEGAMRYAVVIERAELNCSAYVPDLPGCIATGPTSQVEYVYIAA